MYIWNLRGQTNTDSRRRLSDLDLLGNFQDGAKTVWTDEKKLVQITGTALFPGDIAPDWPSLSGGTVTVFGWSTSDQSGK